MPMGMADVATVLFEKHLKFDAARPTGPTATASCCPPATARCCSTRSCTSGYAGMTLDEIRRFRQLGSKTAGHPEYGHAKASRRRPARSARASPTPSAWRSPRHHAARFGKKVVDHRTWVIAGDGCLMEGISHEAIGLAGDAEAQADRALGRQQHLHRRGGGLSDVTDQARALRGRRLVTCIPATATTPPTSTARSTEAKGADRPVLIACRPTSASARRASRTPRRPTARRSAPRRSRRGAQRLRLAARGLRDPRGRPSAWAEDRRRGAGRPGGVGGAARRPRARKRAEFERVMSGEPPKAAGGAAARLPEGAGRAAPKVATRKSSEMVLEVINA
jgi:transketolase